MSNFVLAQLVGPITLDNPPTLQGPVEINLPGSTKSNNFIKGLRAECLLGSTLIPVVYTNTKNQDIELIALEVYASGYSDGDYWDLLIESVEKTTLTINSAADTSSGAMLDLSLGNINYSNRENILLVIDNKVIDRQYYTIDDFKILHYVIQDPIVDKTVTIVTDNIIDTKVICESIFTKETGELKSFLPVEKVKFGDRVKVLFHNISGSQKTLWVDLKFLK